MRKVEVVTHQPQWQNYFEIESCSVASTLDENMVSIHHIGSTAIPHIYAKPIIDLLVEVKDILVVDQCDSAMEKLGYVVMGEFGITDRRFFLRDNSDGIRTHHVHIFGINSPQIQRHLNFRDYLIAHPRIAQKYSDLKRDLARKYPQDINGYMDGKDGFIKEIDKKAVQWRTEQTS